MIELRYKRSCSVRVLWQKLCQNISSVVVSDITAMVESRTMVNHKYYRRGSVMILQQQCCQVITAFLKLVSSH